MCGAEAKPAARIHTSQSNASYCGERTLKTKPATTTEDRLARLEAQNRTLKRVALTMTVVFATAILAGANFVQQTREISVVGLRGEQRAWLGTNDRYVYFQMFDTNAKMRTQLGEMTDGTAGLLVYGKQGNLRGSFSVDQKSGKPSLVLVDRAGNNRMWLDEGGLTFYDESGNVTKQF